MMNNRKVDVTWLFLEVDGVKREVTGWLRGQKVDLDR